MSPFTVEILARVGSSDPHTIGRATITDPRRADAQVASLLRGLADEMERESSEPETLGALLPSVVASLADNTATPKIHKETEHA